MGASEVIGLSAGEVLDRYFLEARARLLEIGATLDRVDRAPDAGEVRGDPRVRFIREALAVLQGDGPGRAERIQRLYSTE